MNNNSVQITNYLQDQMSAEERKAFEEQLALDKELQSEVAIQRKIIAAAVNAGLKTEFANALRKKTIVKRITRWGIAACTIGAVIILFIVPGKFSGIKDLNIAQSPMKVLQPFITPPLQRINVPFSEYIFDAEKGDTIFHSSGSIIYFPPFALVDRSGNPVKGKVRIAYREFNDPLDFFVSGIPMSYDSAGKKYNFESSGMCEINAYQDNKAVFINQQAKPRISLSAKNNSPLHNVYFLDTVARSWKYNGKDSITAVKDIAGSKIIPAHPIAIERNAGISMVKPLKPMKASDDRPVFNIAIEPGSFEELFAYDNLKFEVVDETNYKASDAEEHWSDVKLEHTATEGIYNITFTNPQRKVSYKVRPVLEGADYAAALKVFNEKNKAYEATLKNRIQKDKFYADSMNAMIKQAKEKWIADSTWNDKMNTLIIARNKKMKEQWQRQMEEQKKQIEEQQRQMEEQKKQMEAQQQKAADEFLQMQKNLPKYTVDMRLSAEIMRTFTINNFGVWNCDHPQYPYKEMPILASYTDDLNNNLSFTSTAVVYKGFNGITQFPGTSIRIIPGSENMIWAVQDASFYYFTYKDFMTAGISPGTNAFTFKMRTSKPFSSYNELREWVEKL